MAGAAGVAAAARFPLVGLDEPALNPVEQKKLGAGCDRLGELQKLAVEQAEMAGGFIGECSPSAASRCAPAPHSPAPYSTAANTFSYTLNCANGRGI